MDPIFMISENIKMFEPHVLILNLTVTTDILKGKKTMLYQVIVFTIHEKI